MPPLPLNRRLFLTGASLCVLELPVKAEEKPFAPNSKAFELTAGPARLTLRADGSMPVDGFAFNGLMPGPLLRLPLGTELVAKVANHTPKPFTLHWQGLRLPNAMDGAANLTQAPIAPNESFTYRFTPPDSGLFAYRPGQLATAQELQGHGLFGLLIVDEPNPPVVDRDLAVVLSDWSAGPKPAPNASPEGRLLAVNSALAPQVVQAAPGARLRLRLCNASTDMVMVVAFEDLTATIIAVDGQPCPAFEAVRNTLPLAPGARFDVLVDLPKLGAQTASMATFNFDNK